MGQRAKIPGERIRLDRLCEGERGYLEMLPDDHPLAGRLRDMGWLAGGEIVCLHKAPSGDPGAYRAAGVTVALRRRDAARIYVSASPPAAAEQTAEAPQLTEECIYGAYGDYGDEDDIGNLLKGGDTYETAR